MAEFNYEQALFGERQQFFRNDRNLGGVRLDRSLEVLTKVDLSGELLLEVGCGVGVFSRSLRHYLRDAKIVACDLSRRAVLQAAQQSQTIIHNVADAHSLPYVDETFQAVVFFDLLEHVQDPEQALKEFCRVLTPGGVLHGYVPCEGNRSTPYWLMRKLGIGANLTRKHAGHINHFSVTDLMSLTRQANLTIRELTYSSQFLGQALDVTMFIAREIIDLSTRSKSQRVATGPAKFHNRDSVQSKRVHSVYDPIRRLVDDIVFREAKWFKCIPWGLGVHLTARKESRSNAAPAKSYRSASETEPTSTGRC